MNILPSTIRSHQFQNSCCSHVHEIRCFRPCLILKQPVPSLPLLSTAKLDYCNSLYYNLSKSQIELFETDSELSSKLLRLKLLNSPTSHPSSDLCTGSRITNALTPLTHLQSNSHSQPTWLPTKPDPKIRTISKIANCDYFTYTIQVYHINVSIKNNCCGKFFFDKCIIFV